MPGDLLDIIQDPVPVFLESGDTVVIASREPGCIQILWETLTPADRRARHIRREHYQRLFHKGLLRLMRAGAI